MGTIRLVNKTRKKSIIGELVRVSPSDSTAFEYVDINNLPAIGVIRDSVVPGEKATIDLINNILYSNLSGKPTTIAGYGITDHKHMGGSVNYSEFDTTGHLTMHGTGRPWRDEVGDALGLQTNGPGVAVNLAEGSMDFAYNAAYHATPALADFLYKNVQLNHDRDLTSSIYPHLHWIQEKNFVPNFLFEYRWQINGGAKTTGWTKLKCNSIVTTYVSGSIHQIAYSSAIAVPEGSHMSDIIQFRIYRDSANVSGEFSGADPYNTGGNASAGILSFDCHFMINSIGSIDEHSK